MEIGNYQKKWDRIIGSYDGDFRSNEDVDKFFTGKFYKNTDNKKRLYQNALPEPYLGDPINCSIVCLNLNPGQYLKEFQDPVNGVFVTKGDAIKSYSSFAKIFPYLDKSLKIEDNEELNKGHKWWENRNKYFNRVFNYEGGKLPFAVEICPWRSSSFGDLKYNKEFLEYVEKNVFDLASQVTFNSDIKLVFSVGAPFRRIFEKLPDRFVQIREITQKNASESGFTYPLRDDGKLVNRRISIWLDKKYNVKYINTSAQGGNKNPSRHFDCIIQELIAQTQYRNQFNRSNNIKYQEKLDEIFADGDLWKHRTFRTVLDPYSDEYKNTTPEEKLDYLKKSINNGINLTDLIEEYKVFYKQENKHHVAKSVDYGLANLLSNILTD